MHLYIYSWVVVIPKRDENFKVNNAQDLKIKLKSCVWMKKHKIMNFIFHYYERQYFPNELKPEKSREIFMLENAVKNCLRRVIILISNCSLGTCVGCYIQGTSSLIQIYNIKSLEIIYFDNTEEIIHFIWHSFGCGTFIYM